MSCNLALSVSNIVFIIAVDLDIDARIPSIAPRKPVIIDEKFNTSPIKSFTSNFVKISERGKLNRPIMIAISKYISQNRLRFIFFIYFSTPYILYPNILVTLLKILNLDLMFYYYHIGNG